MGSAGGSSLGNPGSSARAARIVQTSLEPLNISLSAFLELAQKCKAKQVGKYEIMTASFLHRSSAECAALAQRHTRWKNPRAADLFVCVCGVKSGVGVMVAHHQPPPTTCRLAILQLWRHAKLCRK
jgi:hypothetical protein